MSGPRTYVDYTTDYGYVCRLGIPSWQATLQGVSAGSSTNQKPVGLRPRVRYVKITATGREKKMVVPNIGVDEWTDPMGTPRIIPLFGVVTPGAANATLEGRTGERTKNIG